MQRVFAAVSWFRGDEEGRRSIWRELSFWSEGSQNRPTYDDVCFCLQSSEGQRDLDLADSCQIRRPLRP